LNIKITQAKKTSKDKCIAHSLKDCKTFFKTFWEGIPFSNPVQDFEQAEESLLGEWE
jgi:hypothetical protein